MAEIPNKPETRKETYLAAIAGQNVDLPPYPITREEAYLDQIAKNGGGGGGYVLPTATASRLGGVKIGSGISVEEDGTISASGGGGGTSNYNQLTNQPQVNGVTLSGNKTTSDLGIEIPTNLADLNDDSTHRTVTDTEKATWNGKSDFSGAYADLTGLPTLGTASAKNVPVSGDASSSQVVMGNDSRLTDSRPASDVSSWAKQSTKPTYTASEVGAIATTQKGVASGVAELDSNGKVPSSQLPSYVDDVIEGYYDTTTDRFYTESTFENVIPPESGKSWVDVASNKSYRWTGSVYSRVDEGVQLGETSGSAYRGDRGKVAYDHSQTTGNPHGTTKSDVGLSNVPNVSTNDQTPTFTQASTRNNIASGEKLSVIFGKIQKFFNDLKTVAFTGSYSDLTDKPSEYPASQVILSDGVTSVDDALNYAETEHKVGKWIDGSDLYEKTIYFGALPNNTTKRLDLNITNLKKVVDIQGAGSGTDAYTYSTVKLPYGDGRYFIGLNITDAQKINIASNYDASAYTYTYVTVRYTKNS